MLGAEELKPISWRVWAGQVERQSGGGGPFQGLEDRVGFVDIRVGHPCGGFLSSSLRTRQLKALGNYWADDIKSNRQRGRTLPIGTHFSQQLPPH